MSKKYEHLKSKAQQLWISGKSLNSICEQLKKGKSTVFYWVRDIPREKPEPSKGQKKGALATSKKWKKWREAAYEEALREAPRLLGNPSFRDFITIYLTEGYRKNRNTVSVGNSNINILRLVLFWVRKLSEKPEDKLDFQLQFHQDQDISQLRKYWSLQLGIEPGRIKFQRKSNSGRLKGRNWRSEWGVLTIRIGDTKLRSKIQAWMDALQEQWKRDVA